MFSWEGGKQKERQQDSKHGFRRISEDEKFKIDEKQMGQHLIERMYVPKQQLEIIMNAWVTFEIFFHFFS